MVKNINISLDEQEYRQAKVAKGSKTWKEYLLKTKQKENDLITICNMIDYIHKLNLLQIKIPTEIKEFLQNRFVIERKYKDIKYEEWKEIEEMKRG